MQFVQLRPFNRRRRIIHERHSACRLGKCNDIPYRLLTRQQHDDAIQAEGYPAVRRSPVLECVQHKAKLLFRFFRFNAKQMKHLALQCGIEDPDTSARYFVPIQDQVIYPRPHFQRISIEKPYIFRFWRSEGMVNRDVPLFVRAVLKKRKIDDPEEVPFLSIHEVQAPGHFNPKGSEYRIRFLPWPRDEEAQITVVCSQPFGTSLFLILGYKFVNGAFEFPRLYFHGDESPCAERLRKIGQSVNLTSRGL